MGALKAAAIPAATSLLKRSVFITEFVFLSIDPKAAPVTTMDFLNQQIL
jgi:hypothetical protein